MADEAKKTSQSSNTERNKKIRQARCARALKKGRKAQRTIPPEQCVQPVNWETKRAGARALSRYQKALKAFTTRPPCGRKGRVLPDCPVIGLSAKHELKQTLAQAKKSEAKVEAPAEKSK